MKYFIKCYLCPGDIVMLVYAIKSILRQHPHVKINVNTSCMELWQGVDLDLNISENSEDVCVLEAHYETINKSNEYPYHFIHGFLDYLKEKMALKIDCEPWHGFLPLSKDEKIYSYVERITGKKHPYWILNAGYKLDYTAKQWDFSRYQDIVNAFPELFFIQIGHEDHIHPELKGKNLINLVGKTNLRQLISLVYHSFGVITGVSFPMLLSYAIEANPVFNRPVRACVVVAGGREPNHWQVPPNSQFLHTCGQLDCCAKGGCWKSRVVPLGDQSPWGKSDNKDESLCVLPVALPTGQVIPKCMDMIGSNEVIMSIKKYMENLDYYV